MPMVSRPTARCALASVVVSRAALISARCSRRSAMTATGPPPSGPWCSAPPETKISAWPTSPASAPPTKARAWRVEEMSESSSMVWRWPRRRPVVAGLGLGEQRDQARPVGRGQLAGRRRGRAAPAPARTGSMSMASAITAWSTARPPLQAWLMPRTTISWFINSTPAEALARPDHSETSGPIASPAIVVDVDLAKRDRHPERRGAARQPHRLQRVAGRGRRRRAPRPRRSARRSAAGT